MGKITKYCKDKGISIGSLAKIVGVNIGTLKNIDKRPHFNARAKTLNLIYTGTLAKFGEGLEAPDYLNWPFLQRTRFRTEITADTAALIENNNNQ